MNKKNQIHINYKRYDYYCTYIDPTHFEMSIDPDKKGGVWHIEQHRDRPYYNDLKLWLSGRLSTSQYVDIENKIYESKNVLKEERLSDQFAEYKVKDNKIKILLKNQQASKLTKYVNTWNGLTKKVEDLSAQQKEINTFLQAAKGDVELVRDDTRKAILEIVDANEAAMSIVVECAGSTLSLAMETEEVKTTNTYIDYKNAWESFYKLIEGKDGLNAMMDQVIKATTTTEFTVSQAKRALRLKPKESIDKNGMLLKEINLQIYFDKFIQFVKKTISSLINIININKKKVNNFTKLVENL